MRKATFIGFSLTSSVRLLACPERIAVILEIQQQFCINFLVECHTSVGPYTFILYTLYITCRQNASIH